MHKRGGTFTHTGGAESSMTTRECSTNIHSSTRVSPLKTHLRGVAHSQVPGGQVRRGNCSPVKRLCPVLTASQRHGDSSQVSPGPRPRSGGRASKGWDMQFSSSLGPGDHLLLPLPGLWVGVHLARQPRGQTWLGVPGEPLTSPRRLGRAEPRIALSSSRPLAPSAPALVVATCSGRFPLAPHPS